MTMAGIRWYSGQRTVLDREAKKYWGLGKALSYMLSKLLMHQLKATSIAMYYGEKERQILK